MDDDDLEFVGDDEIEIIYSDDEENQVEEDEEADDIFGEAAPIIDDDIDVVDTSKLTFDKHSRSVFSCDLNKTGNLAVTGGEDDNAYVWDTTTGEIVFECTGHQDSVTEVAFNFDSSLIATGDMGGMIQVWNVKEKKLIWCYEGDDMEWLMWHPLSNVLIAGCKSGDIYVWQIPQGNCKVLPSHGSPCTCGRILPDGKRLITGYDDGQVKLWDIKTSTTLWQLNEPQDKGIISVEINTDGSLLATAPSGNIIKTSDGKTISVLMLDGSENEIESHLFIDELGVYVSGSLNGQLCVWDIARQIIRHQAKIDCSVTIMKKGLKEQVYVGTTNGAIYICDVRSGKLLDTLTGHKADILNLTISQDGTKVLSTSDDGTAKIFIVK